MLSIYPARFGQNARIDQGIEYSCVTVCPCCQDFVDSITVGQRLLPSTSLRINTQTQTISRTMICLIRKNWLLLSFLGCARKAKWLPRPVSIACAAARSGSRSRTARSRGNVMPASYRKHPSKHFKLSASLKGRCTSMP